MTKIILKENKQNKVQEVKLIFIGTRGGIKARSLLHYQQSSLLILHRGQRIMLDCGSDWLGLLPLVKPTAILITHGHPDHSQGLTWGAPCTVYATLETHSVLARYPLPKKKFVIPQIPFNIGGLTFTAFVVEHSLNAPAVGYRIEYDSHALFYAPDVASIVEMKKVLDNVSIYIGDGALVERTMLLRRRNKDLIGHAPIKEQLQWCQQSGVPCMFITHCGTEIVTGQTDVIRKKIDALAQMYNVKVTLAYDGMNVMFRNLDICARKN